MANMFNRSNAELKGSFSIDDMRMAFGDLFGVGLIAQSIGTNYARPVTQIYEMGTGATYLIDGRAAGQATLGRVLGPRNVQSGFYSKFGDVCNAVTNNILFQATAGCSTGGGGGAGQYDFGLRACVITNISLQAQAENALFFENSVFKFVSMDVGS